MTYKVFLVEDEIVTREGIRDEVDWRSEGFEFCGEASDGEIALPLIEDAQPAVLITDIKMPFMDGLQLSKIVRERMPWIKIIILSGHDEFNFAQAAVKLGVSEYLLKPVSVQDINEVLRKVAKTLDKEKQESDNLRRLEDQVDNTLILMREKFLLRLLIGSVPYAEAIEQSQQLNLDIIANWYQVILIKLELCEDSRPFDFQDYQTVERIVSGLVESNPDVLIVKKAWEDLVLLIKGDNPADLSRECDDLAKIIRHELAQISGCILKIEMGAPQQRLSDVHHSYSEAVQKIRSMAEISHMDFHNNFGHVEQLKLDQIALEHYLKTGVIQDFDEFFDRYFGSICEASMRSHLVKHYFFMDILLTVAHFVKDLGGDVEQIIPEMQDVGGLIERIASPQQMREATRRIFSAALAFRNSGVNHERKIIMHEVQAYIDNHLADSDISLNNVAASVNLSPSHFSVVFSQEVGESFRDYITQARIRKAKELLRTTHLKCYEVAFQCGYNDPHYFSYVFKKNTGLSPQRFRDQIQADKK